MFNPRTFPTNHLLGITPDYLSPQSVSHLDLGKPTPAVVIGGGIGGLLAARVLANHFSRVIVLERDDLSGYALHRKGVPQGRHVHAMLSRGVSNLKAIFPGLRDELVARGAPVARSGSDVAWFQNGGFHTSFSSNTETILASRPLLEHVIRTRVRSLRNVEIIDRCAVEGLVAGPDGETITGVLAGSTGSSPAREISAALVVDSAGRGSHIVSWLTGMGYKPPAEARIPIGTRYATWQFKRAPNDLAGIKVCVVAATPQQRRSGVALAQEGDRWLVTLAGRNGEQPPAGVEGFLEYARSLPSLELYRLASTAEPIGNCATYGFQENRRRYFENLERFPNGLLPFADAICAFNPVYGQGMTVATVEARVLDACLEQGLSDLAARFYRMVSPTIDDAWKVAAASDMRFIDRKIPRKVWALNWYFDRMHTAAQQDPYVARMFHEVVNMNEPPSSLLQPAIAIRVAASAIPRFHKMPTPMLTRPSVDPGHSAALKNA
jgi:2-polyprenyl-6-methoxyphenol hydroxylase-like FAD-dependent oxidoreductase